MNKVTVQALLRNARPLLKLCGASAALVAIVVLLMSFKTPSVRAGEGSEPDQDESKVQMGFAIAPVPLNLDGKNKSLVGLGSYIVNAQSGCNGCHSQGPATEFARGGNPYFGQPEKINPATYLGGGRDFGPFPG